MADVLELQERRNELGAKSLELGDKCKDGKWERAEDKAAYDKVNDEYDSVVGELETALKAEDVAKRAAQIREIQDRKPFEAPKHKREDAKREQITVEDRSNAFAMWVRDAKRLSQEQIEFCQRAGFNPYQDECTVRLDDTGMFQALQHEYRSHHPSVAGKRYLETRATMSSVDAAAGGAFVPDEAMLRQYELNRLAFGGMNRVSETIVTSDGTRLPWPTVDDTSNTGEIVGESQNLDNSGAGGPNPTLGRKYWDAYKFSSKVIKVPFELLRDSAFDVPGLIGQLTGERIGRIQNTKFTVGTGANEPKGIVTCASDSGITGTASITFDHVIDIQHALDPAYRFNDGFMCHDSTVKVLRKLKDSQNNYLWTNGVQVGSVDHLDGKPLTVNQDIAQIGSSAKSLIYGRLNSYKIRRVRDVRFKRFDELYGAADEVGFMALESADGNALDAGTAQILYYQNAA